MINMPIWNPYAIDYSKGVHINPDGTINGNVIGCWVDTIEESKAKLKKREGAGEFN